MTSEEDRQQRYAELLGDALRDLRNAADRMLRAHDATPPVALPRPRQFVLAGPVQWPAGIRGERGYRHVESDSYTWLMGDDLQRLQEALQRACRGQPRRILHAIRQLQAASRWCDARVAGMERERAEIIRQQSRAAETLEAMASMAAVAKLGGGAGNSNGSADIIR